MEDREIVEALIFATHGALPLREMLSVLPQLKGGDIEALVDELNGIYDRTGRSFRIARASEGYMFVTRDEFSFYLKQLQPATRLSPAALEVLALIAYKGPCTKQTIDGIRGVDSASSLKNLLRHQLIDIKSGKPMRYCTTPRFLEMFGLDSLADLPDISQFEEIFGESAAGPETETAEG